MTEAGHVPWLDTKETHCAGIVLVGDTALKFKKPVDLGFLDFTTKAARDLACRREVDLNRRFSPDVYRGVATLTMSDGSQEPVVTMRRMPDDRRLSHLVALGVDVSDDLRQLARLLAVVHSRSGRRPEVDQEASVDRLRDRWEQSFAQVRDHVDVVRQVGRLGVLDDIEDMTRRFLDGREPLFAARVSDGFAVDGHADLLADDVFCLDDGPRVLDCLEFDDRLRYLDGLDDACFLAMDLERLGAPNHASAFLDAYAEYAGDTAPPSLVHHYAAYRAFVRAKVVCLRTEQDSSAAGGLGDYLDLTQRHLSAGAVTLTLVGGPPGSGKTSVATGAADRLGMVVLSADRVRKELAGVDPLSSAAAPFGAGIYTEEHTARTYDELLSRAAALLSRGESVVLDASWTRSDLRVAARVTAERTHSDLVELTCVTDPDIATARVADRAFSRAPELVSLPQLSDADAAVAVAMRAAADAWPEALEVDTTRRISDAVEQVVGHVRPGALSETMAPPRRRSLIAPD